MAERASVVLVCVWTGRGIDGPPPVSASLYGLRPQTALRRTIDPSPSSVFSGAEHRPPGLGGALAGVWVRALLDGIPADGTTKICEAQNVSCHAVFGQVIDGQDVVDALSVTGPGVTPEAIQTIEIIEN